MLGLQSRVAAQNFRLACPFSQAIEDISYQDAGAFGAQLPRTDVGIRAQVVAPIGHSPMVTSGVGHNEKPDPETPDRVVL
jgi:hypothetical protein